MLQLTAIVLCTALSGQTPQWIEPPVALESAGFGRALAMEGNLLVVGAPEHPLQDYRAGNAEAFFRFGDTWQPIGPVVPGQLEAWDEYGSDIVLDDDLGAIACPGRERVYLLFNAHGSCVITGEVGPPAGHEGTRFGTSVALHEDLLVVGAQLDDTAGTDAGAVHVFRLVSGAWTHEAHLVPSVGGDFAWAGRSVAVHGDRVAFGANLEAVDGQPAAGSVYLFTHDDDLGWQETQRLVHPQPRAGDYLGFDVAMDAHRLVAGAILADGPNGEEDIGEVVTWTMHPDGAVLEDTIPPPDLIGGEFGYSVAIEGDRLVVGAIFNPLSGPVAGAAYRLAFDGAMWRHAGTSFPPPPQDGAQMGFAVALSGDHFAAGCPRFDAAPCSGQVLVDAFAPTCPADTNDDGVVDVDDLLLIINQWGPCPTCDGDVTQDGVVGVDDLLEILSLWGECVQP